VKLLLANSARQTYRRLLFSSLGSRQYSFLSEIAGSATATVDY
jgi:hypothetical protein